MCLLCQRSRPAHLRSLLANPSDGPPACPLYRMGAVSPQAVAKLSSLNAGPCSGCKGKFFPQPFPATVDLPLGHIHGAAVASAPPVPVGCSSDPYEAESDRNERKCSACAFADVMPWPSNSDEQNGLQKPLAPGHGCGLSLESKMICSNRMYLILGGGNMS